ncbi:MAG: regulatory protein RecX [Eggerthellaceae bacterium]|nr:regulatory protein RecX [Eggerthellaceae bacterium]
MPKTELIAQLKADIRTIESGDSGRADIDHEASRSSRSSSKDSTERDAFKKIIALVNVSDRSEKAIRERLERDDFEAEEIEESVIRAKECGFIDDIRFGEVLVRSRISQGKGSVLIARELSDNGIDPFEVPGWPDEYPLSFDDELERALSIIERKPPRSKNKREGAYRKLVQRGYPSAVASSAARMWEERLHS